MYYTVKKKAVPLKCLEKALSRFLMEDSVFSRGGDRIKAQRSGG